MITNYAGYVAWGEYPFAFAACLEQEECYRLMLSKGANHDLQDINGCTVAHVLVVFDLMRFLIFYNQLIQTFLIHGNTVKEKFVLMFLNVHCHAEFLNSRS